jgi:hypothetical protein
VLFLVGALLLLPLGSAFALRRQEKTQSSSRQVVFEMATVYWGIYADDCKKQVNLRLYSDGKIEYEKCKTKRLATGAEVTYVEKQEATTREQEVLRLIDALEDSEFQKSYGVAHSGLTATDIGWNITLTYCKKGSRKSLEVRNYVPDSEMIPKWLHRIIFEARALIPQN